MMSKFSDINELSLQTSTLSGLSIQLVEDDENDFLITRRLLNQIVGEGRYQLDWKTTVDGALSASKENSYDVYLIDYKLEFQNGLDLVKILNPRSANTPPIIILTGGDSIQLELEALNLGVSDCIFKNQLTPALLERSICYAITRKQNERDLRANEIRFRAVLETANEGIITLDDHGIINSYNPAAEKMFGYKADEIIGENIQKLMPASIGEKHDGYVQNYLKSGAPKIIGTGREVCGLRKDDSRFPLYLSVSDVGIPGSHRFSGFVRDLTLEKQAEDTIRSHNEMLELTVKTRTAELEMAKNTAVQANNSKSEFLANITHEIRTPLYGILSFANMGVSRADEISRDKATEYFRHINDSGNRLLNLLNDLLDLSKLEANNKVVSFSEEDLLIITKQCFQSEHARLSEKNIHCTLNNSDNGSVVECYPDGIRQLIANLLSNAIRFSPIDGAITISLEATNVVDQNSNGKDTIKKQIPAIRFCIIDEGVGVPDEEKEVIFEKFVQSSNTNTGAGGTGLGLAICKEIIQLHKGNIWVENRSEVGSKFCFEIPVKQENYQGSTAL